MSPRLSPAPAMPPPAPPAPGHSLASAAAAVSPVLPPLGLPEAAPPSLARGAVAVAAERGDAPDPIMPRAGPSLPPRPSSAPPSALLPASAGAVAGPPATGAAVAPARRVTAPAVAVVGPPDPAPLGATPGAPATGDPPSGSPSRAAPEHPPPRPRRREVPTAGAATPRARRTGRRLSANGGDGTTGRPGGASRRGPAGRTWPRSGRAVGPVSRTPPCRCTT